LSRIGRVPVAIPNGVKVGVSGSEVTVEGPKGSLTRRMHPELTIEVDRQANAVVVKRPSDQRQHRALHGLTRSLINNMVIGVTDGYSRKLLAVGVGYTARLEESALVLQVGYAHPVRVPIPPGLTVEPPVQVSVPVPGVGATAGFEITVTGMDKELVGKYAAGLRRVRPPEPYKGKGIRYADETVKIKPGKAFVSGE